MIAPMVWVITAAICEQVSITCVIQSDDGQTLKDALLNRIDITLSVQY